MYVPRWFLALAIGVLELTACHPSAADKPIPKKEPAMSQEVSIKLGELGPDFAKRYPTVVKVQHQPAGVDFYGIDWDKRPRGVVHFQKGNASLVIEDVLGISAMQDLGALKAEGFSELNVFAGVTEPDLISHDEARLKTYALLRRLLDTGWKSTIARSRPRLAGKERLAYVLNVTNSIDLDPSYLPTFEEWMLIPSHTGWRLYADRVFMDINFTRESTLTDPAKPGSYLLTFKITSETEHFRSYVESEDRPRWKELLPAILSKLAATRAQREAELKAKGVTIDETYQDPPLPKL